MANTLPTSLRGDRFSTSAWVFLACATIAAIAWHAAHDVVLQTALSGFTPVGMMHPADSFPGFAANFPNGEGEMMRSLVGRVYLLLGTLGLPERASAMAMIAAEAAVMMGGAFWLARRTSAHLPVWTALAAAVLVSAGTIASADFARWFHPYYGSVYNYAFGFGFAALAATLARRLVLGGVLIGIAAAVHPIIALFIGVAMGLAVVASFRSYRIGNALMGGLAAVAVFGSWYLIAYRGTSIAGGAVDGELFTTLTRLMSWHWHPIGLDIFGARAWEVLLPFCALSIVFVAALSLGHAAAALTDRQIVFAVAGLFLISLAGLWLSEVSTSPLWIKLALHRASLVLLLLCAIVSVPRLMMLAVAGPFLAAMIAAGLLLTPFWRDHGLPLGGAVVFAAVILREFAGVIEQRSRLLLIAALAVIAGVCAVLLIAGHAGALAHDISETFGIVVRIGFLGAFALMIAARKLEAPALAAAAVAVAVLSWTPQLEAMRNPEIRAKAERFLEVQEWARTSTPSGSVFMLDPAQSYAWRQYSRRPSFGTLREWLYSGWIYNTRQETMAEGLRRAGLLGIGTSDLTAAPGKSSQETYDALVAKARNTYAALDARALDRLAADNNIAYFVFERASRPDLSGLDVVFENEQYVVVKPSG